MSAITKTSRPIDLGENWSTDDLVDAAKACGPLQVRFDREDHLIGWSGSTPVYTQIKTAEAAPVRVDVDVTAWWQASNADCIIVHASRAVDLHDPGDDQNVEAWLHVRLVANRMPFQFIEGRLIATFDVWLEPA